MTSAIQTADTPEAEAIREIIDRAKQLSSVAREVIAHELLDGVDVPPGDPEEVRQAWKIEIARRVEEYRRGEVVALDASGSAERIRARLREKFGYDA